MAPGACSRFITGWTVIKTAVIGASGYIGRHLFAAYRAEWPDCVGTSFSRSAAGLTYFDIRTPDLKSLRLEETGHRAILLAAACPLIKRCEDEKEATYAVNVTGTLEFFRQISMTSLEVIFLSSDYVFAGNRGPHDDDEPPAPSTEYGRHKAIVETKLPRMIGKHLILRLSKVFGLEKSDGTLLDEMAHSLADGVEVRAAADQIFSPTYVDDLTNTIMEAQARGLTGIMNLASAEVWSRYLIARDLARAMKVDPALVRKISLYDMPSMAGRPLDTSLLCTRLTKEVGAEFRPMRACIEQTAVNWSAILK